MFGRENLVGDPNANFNAQLLAATTTSLGSILGLNSSGLNLAVTITSALGLSLQGVLSQTSDTVAAEGGGTDVNRSLPLEIFGDLGTAVKGGQRLLESALDSVGGALGLKFDEHSVAQTIEDVVSILFPHLPLHVLPSVIHNLLGSAPKKIRPHRSQLIKQWKITMLKVGLTICCRRSTSRRTRLYRRRAEAMNKVWWFQ